MPTKKKESKAPAAAVPLDKGKAKASEIDDIFGGKTAPQADGAEKTKKKKKQSEAAAEGKGSAAGDEEKEVPAKKRKAVDEIADPSVSILAKEKKQKKKQGVSEEERDFMDSRGKKRAMTEDGLRIFTEKELGINDESGGEFRFSGLYSPPKTETTSTGTPLCPFDCDCCF